MIEIRFETRTNPHEATFLMNEDKLVNLFKNWQDVRLT